MFTAVRDTRDTEPGRSYHPTMPSWRCPHCSTPQTEASRCWVCHRSSTSCGTCRHFRGSVAGKLGFCGLDRRREPLVGDEVRACWQDGALPIPPDPVTPGLLDLLTVAAIGEPRPGRDAVELPTGLPAAASVARPDRAPSTPSATATPSGSRRLWVEVEV